MIETIGDEQMLSPFITSFEDRGFAHFQGVYTADQIEAFHDLHSDVVADWCYVNGSDITPDAVGGLLERFPRRILHAVSHPLLLGFAECPFTGGSDLRRWAAIRCTGITEPLAIEGYQPVPREWTLSPRP